MSRQGSLLAPLVLLCACASVSPAVQIPDEPPMEIEPGQVQLAVDITRAPYKLTLPPALNVPGNVVWGLFRICAGGEGEVSDVTILTSAAPEVDAAWVKTMRSWRYRPHLVNGHPVPFCFEAQVQVLAAEGKAEGDA